MIYLSSYRFGNNAGVLRRREGHAGIIMNALDVYGETRLMNWEREVADLERLGYSSEEIDLREYFDDADGLSARLAGLDLLWVVGGNSFVLARAMNASGFHDAIGSVLERGLIYAGYSAGACVAGPDLRGIDLIDDPDVLPEGYEARMPVETLGLVSFRIVPHVGSNHPESADAGRVVALLEREGLAYRALKDGDAVIVDGRV
ncbi:MAG TPA: Type 1 glutamine amidotransferase-like domain-containing protein [Thermomicrobiales bacterium]|nr:Type 1 glutamine amidotransferase-like domain-containing protein [Thermomicrobiales bacterium]